MTPEERIADLERQVKRQRGGFSGGFFGCFGVLAAIILVVFVLLALGQCARSARDAGDPIAAESRQYVNNCVAGGVDAKYERGVSGLSYRIGEDPRILTAGPSPHVECPFTGSRGEDVKVTIEVHCSNPVDAACTTLLSVDR